MYNDTNLFWNILFNRDEYDFAEEEEQEVSFPNLISASSSLETTDENSTLNKAKEILNNKLRTNGFLSEMISSKILVECFGWR